MPPSFFIAAFLIGNVLVVGAYDVFAVFFLAENETVSYWVQTWLRHFPILGIALGIVIGHLAWPLTVATRKEQ